MTKPRLLDLFCGAGGAARGYQRAGFYVVGVDINPRPRYAGDEFIQADALTFPLAGFDVIHASPPCQAYSNAQRLRGRTHPDLIRVIRQRIHESPCLESVIENVVGARPRLIDPVELCGAMFGLKTYRHRLFETTPDIRAPWHPTHAAPNSKMGRPVRDGEFMHIVGNFSGVERARRVMECPWMTRDELREAIPPAYTEFIGARLMASLAERAA